MDCIIILLLIIILLICVLGFNLNYRLDDILLELSLSNKMKSKRR